jgi:hypothetical protein
MALPGREQVTYFQGAVPVVAVPVAACQQHLLRLPHQMRGARRYRPEHRSVVR